MREHSDDKALREIGKRIAPAKRGESLSENLAGRIFDLKESVEAGFKLVAEAIANNQPPPQPWPKPLEVLMSFIVKDDNPDVNYSVTVGEAKDAEGNVVPDAALGITVESDQPDVVAVTSNEDPKTGSVHFGNPGNATITVNVFSGETLLGSGAASFVVTAGDPASISGVAVAFDGLTEV